ncbi:glycosyltransferase family 2 protein [Acinetobacter ursingii]|uniref:glycosyltransferase family 2 protein n=1 Tax=Acinetobacter ursingii TaxID=108980 RepID=UPI00124DBF82|nr:glycosyltransferase [Acinetobacter ursingii]
MLFSLIIPIYNVEKYIIECLSSISIQLSNQDVEILLIDDGSPDNSVTLINDYLEILPENIKHKFRLIRQQNKGLSGARNTGIDAALGRYIGFLDSDDKLYERYFDCLLDVIISQDVDIIEFEATRFDDNSNIFYIWKPAVESGFYLINDLILNKVATQSAWYAWKRIYKRELFKDIKYPIGKNFEDIYTTPYLYLAANTMFFINEILINYRYNANSITNVISDKNLKDMKDAILGLSMTIDDHPYYMGSLVSSARMYVQMLITSKGFFYARFEWKQLRIQLKFSERRYIVKQYVKSRKHLAFYYGGIIVAWLVILKAKI